MKHFKVQFKDFERRTWTKYWKKASVGAVHEKLRSQVNNAGGVTITELTPEQYELESKAAPAQRQGRRIYNRRRASV